MLLHHAVSRNYSKPQGWAAHKFKEKFDVWPRGLDDFTVTPDGEVTNYIRSRQIAYAKRLKKAEVGHAA
jgi:hypothetical protein